MEESFEFQMFRATVHPSPSLPLLASRDPKPAILQAAIIEGASATSPRGGRWHIGNIVKLETGAFCFRLGRLRSTSVQQLDEHGNFIDSDFSLAPNTLGVVDTERELVALARNSALAPTPQALGRGLALVLSGSRAALNRNVIIEAAPIRNPVEFIERIQRSYAVRRLWVVTRRPNPFDTDKLWVKPTSEVMEQLAAETVKTEWRGQALQAARPEVAEIVKSTASTGGDAGATVIESKESGPKRISLSSDFGSFSLELNTEKIRSAGAAILGSLRDMYSRIRDGD